MVALTIGGFIIAAVFAVMTQLFHVTTTSSNYMAAFRQVQDAGDWISRDALMTQQVYGEASIALSEDINASQTIIPVVESTEGFPPSGVISIDDELIQYTFKTDTAFGDLTHPVTRGDNATAHDEGKLASFLVALDWMTWSGDQHQVFYNLKVDARQLARSYLVNGNLTASAIIAEAIDPGATTSEWDYSKRELSVAVTATVGKYVLWKPGTWESTATRTYKINPRPLF
jgi:hypothetical protein